MNLFKKMGLANWIILVIKYKYFYITFYSQILRTKKKNIIKEIRAKEKILDKFTIIIFNNDRFNFYIKKLKL